MWYGMNEGSSWIPLDQRPETETRDQRPRSKTRDRDQRPRPGTEYGTTRLRFRVGEHLQQPEENVDAMTASINTTLRGPLFCSHHHHISTALPNTTKPTQPQAFNSYIHPHHTNPQKCSSPPSSPAWCSPRPPPSRPGSSPCTTTSTMADSLTLRTGPMAPLAARCSFACLTDLACTNASSLIKKGNLNGAGDKASSVRGGSGCTTFFQWVHC